MPILCDFAMYVWRHLFESFFCALKAFRRIATRHDKTDHSFAARINLAATALALIECQRDLGQRPRVIDYMHGFAFPATVAIIRRFGLRAPPVIAEPYLGARQSHISVRDRQKGTPVIRWIGPLTALFVVVLVQAPTGAQPASVLRASKGIGVIPLVGTAAYETPAGKETVYAPNWQQCDPRTVANLRSSGVDLVRLVFSPLPLMTDDPEARKRAAGLVLECGSRLSAGGLAVVYDPQFWSPPDLARNAFDALTDPARFERYRFALLDLATRLIEHPHDSVALELFNEPPPNLRDRGVDWWEVQLRLIDDLRAISKDLLLVVTGAQGTEDDLARLDDPRYFGDNRLLYTLHFYEPFIFTHQFAWGATHVDLLEYPPQRDETGLLLQKAEAIVEKAAVPDVKKRQIAGDIGKYLASGYGPSQIDRHFGHVAEWARTHGIPPNRIFVGEFGACIGFGPSDGSPEVRRSELRWIADVRRAIEREGFLYSYWNLPRPGAYAFDPTTGYLKAGYIDALGLTQPGRLQ